MKKEDCPKYPCKTCVERFVCYTNPMPDVEFSATRKAKLAMIQFNVPIPTISVYCTKCGKKAKCKISIISDSYGEQSGIRQVILKATVLCPKLIHNLRTKSLKYYRWDTRYSFNWDE